MNSIYKRIKGLFYPLNLANVTKKIFNAIFLRKYFSKQAMFLSS